LIQARPQILRDFLGRPSAHYLSEGVIEEEAPPLSPAGETRVKRPGFWPTCCFHV